MPVLGKSDYRVLNVVALKKMTSTADLAVATGLEAGQVESRISVLSGLGLVAEVGGFAMPADEAEALADLTARSKTFGAMLAVEGDRVRVGAL